MAMLDSPPYANIWFSKSYKNSFHSSRMRIACFNGHLYMGCLPRGCPGCVCVCLRGSGQRKVVYPGGLHPQTQRQTLPRPRGRHPQTQRQTSPPAHCMLGYTPPTPTPPPPPHVNRMTDRCKNITFLQLRLRAAIKEKNNIRYNK